MRAKKTFNGGSGYNWFLYDGDEPLCEIDGSGNVAALHTFRVNSLVSRRCNGATGFYVFAPSGNGTLLSDGYGVETDYTHSADPQSLLILVYYVYPRHG